MCSILGYFGTNQNIENIAKLNSTLSHRGPDFSDTKQYRLKNTPLFLAHNRLSIQDLSSLGNQPMENDRFAIVFNGEIYNHLELRCECGCEWKTTSDTETLLELFSGFGVEKTLSKLIDKNYILKSLNKLHFKKSK